MNEFTKKIFNNKWTEATEGHLELGNQIAEYIQSSDREEADYNDWCEENNLYPVRIGLQHLNHIYAKALYWLYSSGYDVDGFIFILPKETRLNKLKGKKYECICSE